MAVYRALEGDGPSPEALWIGRYCEAFGCVPSAAYAEWLRSPVGFLDEILEARAFTQAKSLVDRARDDKDLPDHPMIQLVKDVMQEAALADMARAREAQHA